MSKKVDIPVKPQALPRADRWVGAPQVAVGAGPTRRLTVDVPADTHARFKAYCAMRQTRMNSEINAFIERCLAEMEHGG